MHRPGLSGDRGVSLIEVAVAVLVLSIGSVAAFRALDAARMSVGAAPERLLAGQVAMNRAAELRALGPDALALPDTVTMAGRDWRIALAVAETAAGFSEVTIRVTGPGGGGTSLQAFLPPEDDTP